ncbi:GNAT family N-acetyltransferase [Paludibacter sp.]|uniref:GNAT family N-acetyltransferase n=1 Tax=Paludibacter sp. TaxID=1898105 RepID=UPI001354D5A7|nr:GNAT family N-acetyltransferase [Paludibacter sp.]MTK52540.1 GNAT family N-acetyltransferase [Paludibacter sp.]
MNNTITLREIQPDDNHELAEIIRSVLSEHGVARPGTVFTDPTTDALYQLFQTPGSVYWVVAVDGKLSGGCGIFPTEGLPEGCAELVKFYVAASRRGTGLGKLLMQKCFESAVKLGYTQLYLESFPELAKAVGMYEKAGFHTIPRPLGNSGHTACTLWMVKDLNINE